MYILHLKSDDVADLCKHLNLCAHFCRGYTTPAIPEMVIHAAYNELETCLSSKSSLSEKLSVTTLRSGFQDSVGPQTAACLVSRTSACNVRRIVLGGDPAPPSPISVLTKWLDGSRCHLVWR